MQNKYAIIGDVHDNYDHLVKMLNKLGLDINDCKVTNTIDRQIVFVGDLIDRGDKPIEVLKLVMDMVEKGIALSVRGNHDDKLYRALIGRNVKLREETAVTLERVNEQSQEFRTKLIDFLENLPLYLSLDNDNLYVVHGAAPEDLQKVNSSKAKSRALYGVTTGKYIDGLPERLDWGSVYKGKRHVVYGHQMIKKPEWINKTIDIDTGCFETGILSCVLWPEKEIIYVSNDD